MADRNSFLVVMMTMTCAGVIIGSLFIAGCGTSSPGQQDPAAAIAAATAFLDACGNLEMDKVHSFLAQDYLDVNSVPDPITRDDLSAAMGNLDSYKLDPEADVSIEGNGAIVTVALDITGKGEKTETLILKSQDGEWKVEGFTAMDWTSKPPSKPSGDVQVEQALRDFVIACVDGQTTYVFEHLSDEYKENHHLQKAWTSAEFSGIFGTARSYNFKPEEIEVRGDRAGVDITIEFGSRGNLQSETSRVELAREGNEWLIDVFPFFIY